MSSCNRSTTHHRLWHPISRRPTSVMPAQTLMQVHVAPAESIGGGTIQPSWEQNMMEAKLKDKKKERETTKGGREFADQR